MTIHGRAGDYIDGAMALHEETAFLDHMLGCRACEAALADELHLRERERELSFRWRTRFSEYVGSRKRTFAAGCGTSVVALAVVLFVVFRPPDPEPATTGTSVRVAMNVSIEAGEKAYRGKKAHPGDLVRVSATTVTGGVFEIRIYRGAYELVSRCPGAAYPVCRVQAGAIESSYTLGSPGDYDVQLLQSPRALPPPTGDREADLRAVEESGGHVAQFETVVVN